MPIWVQNALKSFMTLTPLANVTKLFFVVIHSNKGVNSMKMLRKHTDFDIEYVNKVL